MRFVLKVSLFVVLSIISISLSGCFSGNPPQPYSQKILLKTKLPLKKEQDIVNDLVSESIHGFKVQDGCVYASIRWSFRSRDRYKNCFVINPDETVKRVDESVCSKDNEKIECSYFGKLIEKYVASLNTMQEKLKTALPERLNAYAQIGPLFDQEERKLDQKISKIKFFMIDDTKSLPKNILAKFQQKAHARGFVVYSKDNFIKRFASIPIEKIKEQIQYNFKVETCPNTSCFGYNEKIDNWSVVFDKQSEAYNYSSAPTDVKYHINSVLFEYFPPKKFILEDANIKAEIINTTTENRPMASFKLYNKTDTFITVEKISGYYNGEIVSLLASQEVLAKSPITLPPHSYKNILDNRYLFQKRNFPSRIAWNNITLSQNDPNYSNNRTFLNVNDFYNNSVEYGFAISYFLNDLNMRKTLYKLENYTIKELISN